MTADLARRWARTVVPSWLCRWLMPAGWVVALAVSMWSDEAPCSVDDPTICGPDLTFSLAMIPCFASLVLWWWQPRVAASAGLVFLILELRYDDVAGARVAWTAYGAACALVLIWLILSRRRQRALTEGLPRRQVVVPPAASVGVTSGLLVAGALVLAGAAALGLMKWQDHREQVHLQRAVEQTAVVEGETDDGDLVLRLPDGSTRTVTMYDTYETGANIPVLVDPADSDWLRPRAEPADYTFWATVVGGAWLLAILLVVRDVRLRRARPRRSWTAQALPVMIEPDASAEFAIKSTDDAVLLGFLDVELDDEEADARLIGAFDVLDEDEAAAPATLKREWAQTLRQYRGEALLVGDLVEGSRPTLVFGDHVLRPVGVLRAPRRLPWATEAVVGLPEHLDDGEAGQAASDRPAAEPAQELPTLPWAVPIRQRPWWARPALAGLVVAAPVTVGVLASWGEWWPAFMLTAGAATVSHNLAERLFYRVTATMTGVRIRTGWIERALSWQSVEAVEAEADRVVLKVDEDWHVAGDLVAGRAAGVAAVFEALRLRAQTDLPTPAASLPAPAASRHPAPGLFIIAGQLIACAAVLVLVWRNPL